MAYIWQALLILFIGFVLQRLSGKKTVSEMTGLEIITLLAIASVIGEAVSAHGFWKITITLVLFVFLLMAIQYLALKLNLVEKWLIGRSTLVIRDGRLLKGNLKRLRLSVDQLEAKLREKSITSIADVRTAAIEINGQLGYELYRQARPVTVGELEKLLAAEREYLTTLLGEHSGGSRIGQNGPLASAAPRAHAAAHSSSLQEKSSPAPRSRLNRRRLGIRAAACSGSFARRTRSRRTGSNHRSPVQTNPCPQRIVPFGISLTRLVDNFTTGHICHSSRYRAGSIGGHKDGRIRYFGEPWEPL
ncbi:DUF421 domain-containing protein [Paenibacillus sp. CC-CFT747]|nr:DUF421 domain-containing protein [Paenibacillus sp. CC-CFT747]